MKTYHFLSRIILFSGDVESNPGPKNKYSTQYLYITHCLRWAELQLMLDEVVFAFLGLYHSNPMEVPKIISMSTVLAFNI